MVKIVTTLLLVIGLWWVTEAVDLTIEEATNGSDTVIASIDKIRIAEIFLGDEQMLRRIAYTETRDGDNNDTYPVDYHGGIWRLSEDKYNTTKQVDGVMLDKIQNKLDINWTATVWRDLRKPLWSALAARIYLTTINTPIPLSTNHSGQADYWFTYYTSSGTNLSAIDYQNAISYLAVNEACKISGMDLFFVLDESGSVGSTNYEIMKGFVNNLISSFTIGENDVQVGLMAFSSSYRIHFNLNEYKDASSLTQAVSNIPYAGGLTNTADALRATLEYAFTEANGGGRYITSGLPRVVVVVTDGFSSSFSATKTAAAELHEEKIIVFAIGIAGANQDELVAIATRPSYVEFTDTFDPIRLRALQAVVSDEACKVSSETPLNNTINDTISNGEVKYFNYVLPSNTTGITLQIDVQSGTITVYASSTTENPNKANHEISFMTDNLTDIYINKEDLRNPNATRIFVALEADNDQNSNTSKTSVKIEAQPGDVTTEPLSTMISEVLPGIIKDVTSFINIRCIASGKPLPTIQWRKEDSIELNEKININSTLIGNQTVSSILSIPYLDVKDTGSYSCVASHILSTGHQVFSSASVAVSITSSSIFISPDSGNMLGGTPVIIRGLYFPNMTISVMCMFGENKTIGIVVSETEAMCITPRFRQHGSKKFLLYLDGVIVKTDLKIFRAIHYSDLADVMVLGSSPFPSPSQREVTNLLIVNSEQEITIKWDAESLSFSGDVDNTNNIEVMVKGFEANIFNNSILEDSISELVVMGATNNNVGSTRITLPFFTTTPGSLQCEPKSPYYSLVMVKIYINPKSITVGDNKYYNAIKSISSATIEVGIWSHVLFRKISSDVSSICSHWYDCPVYHNHLSLMNLPELPPCPCNKTQADKSYSRYKKRDTIGKEIVDTILRGSGATCYDQHQLSNEASQECCYNNNGELIVIQQNEQNTRLPNNPPRDATMLSGAGSVNAYSPSIWESYAIFDLIPFIACCFDGNQCSKYYNKRPSADCTNYMASPSATCYGDPHMRTIDGFEYTFNGRGEFILLTTEHELFTFQGRMESITTQDGSPSLGTIFSALAAQEINSDTVEFRKGDPLPTIYINGIQTEIMTGQSEEYQGVIISVITNNTFRAIFSSGVSLQVEQNNNFLSSVSISVPRSYHGLTKGLMGVYNDDESDDLLPRYSTTPLSLNATIERLHYDFGLTWLIDNQSESLFTYENSNSFQSFYDPSFVPVFSPTFSDPLLKQEAMEICEGDLSCLFDIAVTGNKEIGIRDTLEQQLMIKERIRLASAPVICAPPCVNGACVGNDTCSCYSGYKGDLCDVEDVCAYNPTSIQCNEAVAGWIFNTNSDMCEFGGCKGRGNIFATMAECIKNCGGCSSMSSNNQTSSECFTNPCHYSTCEAFPHAKCEVDACNPCSVVRFTSGTREVTDICKLTCENGNSKLKPTDCVVQPCEVTLCPNYPNAVCLPDYCEGCKAKFFNSFGVEVTDECTNCPPEKPSLKCPHNLCHFQTCHNIPDATCILDTCGQCRAKFYHDGADVTDQCDFCEVKGQRFNVCGSACSKTCSNYSENRDCLEPCRPKCECPENMVLDEQKNECVLIENCPCTCNSLPANCSSVIQNTNDACGCPICKDCPEGQVFQDCMSCPRTCSEQSDALFKCASQCKPGCQCPDGQLYDDSTNLCILKENCGEPDRCILPPMKGPCLGNIRRYYYNTETQKCDQFRYGGCQGNENNFFSLHKCEQSCSELPPTCSPLYCIIKRTNICTLRDTVSNRSAGCPSYEVSNCQACYYSPAPLSPEEEAEAMTCDMDCVTNGGEYDEECLKKWGSCLKRKFIFNFRSVPLNERIPENYKCFKYNNGCNN